MVKCFETYNRNDVSFLQSRRQTLAALHFNENLKREMQKSKEGKEYYSVTYPKFKLGEEVVREVPVPPTYGNTIHKNCVEMFLL